MDTAELRGIVEALLFASEFPLMPERIAEALDADRETVARILAGLMKEYREGNRGFMLVEVAGGYQFRTRPEHMEWVRRMTRAKPFRFSRAALETLAIVAYRQPISRAEIEYLRGVDAGGVLKTLLDRHLVRILGKKDVPGRPMIYGTTREFLELFGLRDLGGLPTLKEFNELSVAESQIESAASSAGHSEASSPEEPKRPGD